MLRKEATLLSSALRRWSRRLQSSSPTPSLSAVSSSLQQRSRGITNTSTNRDAHVELTQVRYPGTKRGAFATLEDVDVTFFEGLLGTDRVLQGDDVDSYNVDWMRMVRGASKLVLKPKTTEEVSAILRHCNGRRLAVCPQGGNTGLVGGSVPVFDEVVISTSLMNNVISIDPLSGVIVCQAGCVLAALEDQLSAHGLLMPLDLGAKGSCQIGGNVSTNAGGIRLLRYGSLQGSVLGVEAVRADGEVIDCLNGLKKDNTGYHLKHLFIGSEGTLGLVTKVAIHCPVSPPAIHVAFLGLKSFEDVLSTFQAARRDLGEVLSSCEMMDTLSLEASTVNLGLRSPLDSSYPFYMLIETAGANASHDEAKMTAFLEAAMTRGDVEDAVLASEPSRIKGAWAVRESISAGLLVDGYVYKYDVSLPLPSFYQMVDVVRERLKSCDEVVRCCGYGHVGDGNLHLNVTSKEYDAQLLKQIEPFVYEWTSQLKGSVSAEHGIGFKKTQFVHYSKSAASLRMMGDIKRLMDPNGILNPYKVLPQ